MKNLFPAGIVPTVLVAVLMLGGVGLAALGHAGMTLAGKKYAPPSRLRMADFKAELGVNHMAAIQKHRGKHFRIQGTMMGSDHEGILIKDEGDDEWSGYWHVHGDVARFKKGQAVDLDVTFYQPYPDEDPLFGSMVEVEFWRVVKEVP